jgi:hypothetical protein
MALIFRAFMERIASSTELSTSMETMSLPFESSRSRTFMIDTP